MSREGWLCPKCNSAHNPDVQTCPFNGVSVPWSNPGPVTPNIPQFAPNIPQYPTWWGGPIYGSTSANIANCWTHIQNTEPYPLGQPIVTTGFMHIDPNTNISVTLTSTDPFPNT